jgi:hypothetical protein
MPFLEGLFQETIHRDYLNEINDLTDGPAAAANQPSGFHT